MIVKNPIDQAIDVQINGHEYHLPALGEVANVPEADAEYWKTKLHQFVVVEAQDAPEEPAAEEVDAEEVIAEVIAEAEPKKEEKKTEKKEVKNKK